MRAIARTLDISRSNLTQRLNAMTERPQTYKKIEDAELLPAILAITAKRASYGYRRVTALLNQELIRQQQPKVNHLFYHPVCQWRASVCRFRHGYL